jgi:cytochrome c oxidase assembly protein subunit 15
MLYLAKVQPGTTHCRRSIVLFLLVACQAALGVWTLLSVVNLHVALTHQGLALIVLFFAVAHWRGTWGSRHLPTEVEVKG